MGKYSFSDKQDERREARRPVKKVPVKPIPKRSVKRIESDKILATIRKNKIAEDAICKIRMPGVCTGFATVLNHKQKSSPKNRLDPDNLEQCCLACNNAIENNIQFAKDNGHQISRFKK